MPNKSTRETRLEQALSRLEAANDTLCTGRSQAAYDQMIADGQTDALIELDNARREARAALSK